MIKQFEDSKLWKIFVQKNSLEIQGKVKVILDKTIPELKHIVRVFPTYTNHDDEHSLKILELIEMLLGDSVEYLSAPEVSVLLLSAFWHDLGMVCNDPNEIKKEVWFEEFVENKPTIDTKNLNNSIVSEYIRINHHKRLEKYLYDTDNILDKSEKELLCDGFDIIKITFDISKSHNYETKDLSKLNEHATNDQKDDFVLCAILLRLADIMDFDNERTPESVYKLLELDNPKNSADEYSQKEWQKHIDSLGFDYINGQLFFKATPKSPDVEHYIREFIKVIEHELEKCKIVFDSSCFKWKENFKLPVEIDISGIKSRGYKFGDYKFSFDNHQVLTLLSGNNIYSNPMIFIRELLQNSIDASLYRQANEREKGKTFQCDAINVTDWYDKEGNYWIRFDDYGIGMDEYILLNYFTKIGKSFYESKDFNKELGFTAISRFGIGILSCFMVADRIEVSTKKENNPAIRFSIKSMDSYFTTQIEGEHPNIDAFPSEKEIIEKYRRKPGTSIAIKIDFNKIHRWFDVQEELLKHIFYSPIEIRYKGQKIGTTLDDLEKNPWIERETIVELTPEDDKNVKDFFELKDTNEPFKLKITPVNLSKYSPTEKINAQMVLVQCETELPNNNEYEFVIDISIILGSKDSLALKLYKHEIGQRNIANARLEIELNGYSEFKIFTELANSKIGHNGIKLGQDFSSSFNEGILNFTGDDIFSIAYIYLSDEYRPTMGLSRSSEVNFDCNTLSVANLALSKFITEKNLMNQSHDCSLIRNRFGNTCEFEDVINDPWIDEWKKEKIFLCADNEYKSLEEIDELIQNSTIEIFNYPRLDHQNISYIYKSHTRQIYVEKLLFLFTDGYLKNNNHYIIERIYSKKKELINEQYFPIGFFVKYDNEIAKKLQIVHNNSFDAFALNIDHQLSKWLINNAELLSKKYKGIFEDIKNTFISHREEKFERLCSLLTLIKQLEPNIMDNEIIESIKTPF